VFDTDGTFKRQFTIDLAPDFNTRTINGATPPPAAFRVWVRRIRCVFRRDQAT